MFVYVKLNEGSGSFSNCVRPARGIARASRNNMIGELTYGPASSAGLKLDLNQPQKTDCHGGDDRLCLYGLNAVDRGRVQGPVLFCYGSLGLIPGQIANIGPNANNSP